MNAAIELKPGVECEGVHTKIWEALWIVAGVYAKYARILVVTSLREGEHKKRSEHYKGNAADLRTKYFTAKIKRLVFNAIKEILGEDYIVIWHKTHIHIHWSPVYHGD